MERSSRNRGFATTAALLLVPVLGVALLLLTSLLSTDARRTRQDSMDAQLRQLLHAGAIDAVSRINSSSAPTNAWDIAMPLQAGAMLRAEPMPAGEDAGHRVVRVIAQIDERKASQDITFARSGDRWQIESVQLNDW